MNVLIYGSKGWIGSLFIEYLKNQSEINYFEGEKDRMAHLLLNKSLDT